MTTGRVPRTPLAELEATLDDGVGVALEDVPESFPPPAGPTTSAQRRAMARGEEVPPPYRDDMEAWEWSRKLEARLAAAEARAESAARLASSAHERAHDAVRSWRRAMRIVTGAAGLVGVGAVAVVKLALASGDRSATERLHYTEHTEDRATVRALQLETIPELRATIAANAASIAGLRGALDQISRLGAVRVLGPAPQPLIPGDPPP